MSRQYMVDKWCCRCGRTTPTPYTVKQLGSNPKMQFWREQHYRPRCVDVGCGNGRNSDWLRKEFDAEVLSFDRKDDHGFRFNLGHEPLPVYSGVVDVVLANYVFMFLDRKERRQVIKEINRIVDHGFVLVELYPARDCFAKTKEECLALQAELQQQFNRAGWRILHTVQERFLAERY